MLALGIIATIIGIIGGLPYIYNSYKKITKPHRFAWFLFLLLSLIALLSQFELGARASLIFYVWFVVNNLILFGLSMRKNAGYGEVNKVNVLCLLLAIAAIILWKTTSSPLIALICVLIADGIGALLIVIKSYKFPQTETMSMWAVGILATFLNVMAVHSADLKILAAPLQVFLFNVAIVLAILLGRAVHKKTKV